MPLQIRRGTDAERSVMTQPLAAGELIYVTDTQRLFVGNGATVGGVGITGYTDSDAQDAAASLFTTGTHTGISFVYDDATNKINAVVNLSAFAGPVVADSVKGSVFADDSTLLVDGVNSEIVGTVNNTTITTTFININQDQLDGSGIRFNNVTAGTNGGNFNFRAARTSLAAPETLQAGDISIDLTSSGWDGTTYSPSAIIKMGTDKYTASIGTGVMPGRILFLTFNEAGTTGVDNAMVFNRFGNLGIATDAPTEKLDVVGNIKASGSIQPGVYADTTARDVAHSSPINGQMIYLTATHKFQGYANGVWVDLN